MREFLDRIIKADHYAQNVADIGRAKNTADQHIRIRRPTFPCLRKAGLKLKMHKCHVGSTQIDFR